MKKLTVIAVVLIALAVAGVGCKACKKDAGAPGAAGETVSAKDATPPEVISSSLSTALCKRMVECAPGMMTEEECVTQTTTSLKDALTQKPLSINKETLDNCVASIGKVTCEEVMGTEPPKGCEFLN